VLWQRPYSKCNPRKKKKREGIRNDRKVEEGKKKARVETGKESRGTSGVQTCPHTMGRVTHITQYAGSYGVLLHGIYILQKEG
jgi:hypothetical protein